MLLKGKGKLWTHRHFFLLCPRLVSTTLEKENISHPTICFIPLLVSSLCFISSSQTKFYIYEISTGNQKTMSFLKEERANLQPYTKQQERS